MLDFLKAPRRNTSLICPGQQQPQSWKDWWADKEIARGQTASESFLLGLVSAQHDKLNALLGDAQALAKLNIRFNGAMDEALDACVAQLQYQDKNADFPPLLMSFSEIKSKFFPYFEIWIDRLLSKMAPNLPVNKNRMISSVIGAAYRLLIDLDSLSSKQWTGLIEFVRRPQEGAKSAGIDWPQSKGRWDGQKGYRAQFEAIHQVTKKLCT